MTDLLQPLPPPADDTRLRSVLTELLSRFFNAPRKIVRLERELSEYRSSYAIEQLDLLFDNGEQLRLIFKNLSRNALLKEAHETRHEFIFNPHREIEVYRAVLSQCALGTAVCYGTVIDEAAGQYWLFIEKVPGLELYQVGEFETWLQAARWLAAMHDQFYSRIEELESRVPLLNYHQGYYELWPARALSFLQGRSGSEQKALKRLIQNYDRVVERLLVLPATLLHGDFFASNILVQKRQAGLRICPVDWEMAAVGPGFVDLAALLSGNWNEEERAALIQAYLGVLQPNRQLPQDQDQLRQHIACCQLHLAMQCLGWAPNWSPPPEHEQDWLQQAIDLGDQLGL